MELGIIGYRNQAKKLIEIAVKNKKIKKIYVFIYRKNFVKSEVLNSSKIKIVFNISLIPKIDAVVISSPTSTHTKYIKYFTKRKIPIFCEKPAASSRNDIRYLKRLFSNQNNIYINYNLLFNKSFKILDKITKNKKYGKIAHIDVKLTNGIAYKKQFQNNWRFKSRNKFEQISVNLGSHYVNFILSLLNAKIISKNITNYNLKKNNDNCFIYFKTSNNITVNLFFSYSTPFSDEITVYFSNAIIKLVNNKMRLYFPRDTFDKKGLFISPKGLVIAKYSQNSEYFSSNQKSFNFFLKNIKRRKNISKYFKNAIKTLEFFYGN